MARPTGVFKRQPNLGAAYPDAQRRYEQISKAQWAELYRDLYAETHGEDMADMFLANAEVRLETLKQNGLAGG